MKKTDMPPIVRQSSGRLKNNGAGRELPDIKFKDGNGGGGNVPIAVNPIT